MTYIIHAYINHHYRRIGVFCTLREAAIFTERTLGGLQAYFPGLVNEWWIESV